MKRRPFSFPMTKVEQLVGWIYLPIHIFLLPLALNVLGAYLPAGTALSDAHINLIYYGFGFVFLLIFMFRYLKASFSDLCDGFWRTIKSVLLGYLFYYFAMYLVNLILMLVLGDAVNPNSELVFDETKLNPGTMTAVAVLLAPVVEELLFRGIAFGAIRKKSRILAYVVTCVIFSVYHLWQFLLGGFDWTILLYMVQYVPAAFALAWCYEQSGTIWAPIFLHMLVNYVSISFQIG